VLRALALVILAVVGVASALMAYGALRNLWADYQDSTTWTYLSIGLPLVALALWCGRAGLRIYRDR
jgi:hypothetical protein